MSMKVHLFNRFYTRLWYTKESWNPWGQPEKRVEIAQMLIKEYPEGCAVANMHLFVVALIKPPGGAIEILKPPYKRVRMSEVANKPSVPDCQCVDWYENESRETWRDTPRAKRGDHHPLCQFERMCFENVNRYKKEGFFLINKAK